MFAFQVRRKDNPREGSIVGPLWQDNGISYVPVMWEDDWSFSDECLGDIIAIPQVPQGTEQENIVAFPGTEEPVH
jgi:hypothetical protein